ncbi:MAG: DUF2927 domain-containing protein, partial [Rhizobiales bacterium]|nr:DUF2927 domain-containing protein [Hyphomicrobiales bacterium]
FNDDVQKGFFDIYDQYLLNILYHPRVRSGMTRGQVRRLLPEIMPEVRAFGIVDDLDVDVRDVPADVVDNHPDAGAPFGRRHAVDEDAYRFFVFADAVDTTREPKLGAERYREKAARNLLIREGLALARAPLVDFGVLCERSHGGREEESENGCERPEPHAPVQPSLGARAEARCCRARMRSARLAPRGRGVTFEIVPPAAPFALPFGTVAGASSAPRISSILDSEPSSAAIRRATSAETSLMRSRSSAFSIRSVSHDVSVCRFSVASSCWRRARSSRPRSSWPSSSSFVVRSDSVAELCFTSMPASSSRTACSLRLAFSASRRAWSRSRVRSASSRAFAVVAVSSAASLPATLSNSPALPVACRSRWATRLARASPFTRSSSRSRTIACNEVRSRAARSSACLRSRSMSAVRSRSVVVCVRNATISIRWPSAVAAFSSRVMPSFENSSSRSFSLRSRSSTALVLSASSSSLMRSRSCSTFCCASSAAIAADFSVSSAFVRARASVFLPRSASCAVVFSLICSTLISSRRVDIANSARSWSLSA